MASLLTEMPSVLDQREVWFTHLLLLGFDPVASEEKYKVTFTRYSNRSETLGAQTVDSNAETRVNL